MTIDSPVNCNVGEKEEEELFFFTALRKTVVEDAKLCQNKWGGEVGEK